MRPPTLVLTGASGFVGRHLLEELKGDWRIFALARRSQHECGAPVDPHIAWMRVDIADRDGLARAGREIRTAGGAEVFIHLAAYYDFTGEPHPEYQRTNVEGTGHVLELARALQPRRFVFGSSVAACAFPRAEGPVSETTPPDGDHVYAASKREGERLVQAAGAALNTAVARLGAVYSDWCEYPPLYVFLDTWLGPSWRSRIIAGRGETAIPYIHVRDVVAFFRHLLLRRDALEPGEVLLASTAGSISHLRLFELATRCHHGRPLRPWLAPRSLCSLGLRTMDAIGRFSGRRPFERPWMRHYIDRRLDVSNARTCARLGWTPNPRHDVERRLPFLVERRNSEPYEWFARNAAAMRRQTRHPDLRIYKALVEIEDVVVHRLVSETCAPGGAVRRGLRAMAAAELEWFVRLLYRLLLASVQSGNRMLLLDYLEVTAQSRFSAGVSAEEVSAFLGRLNATILGELRGWEDCGASEQELHDRITLPIELGQDEVREQHERFLRGTAPGAAAGAALAASSGHTPRELIEETIWRCLVQRK
jgi:nucleoside-diphosphate-sugar epimerase